MFSFFSTVDSLPFVISRCPISFLKQFSFRLDSSLLFRIQKTNNLKLRRRGVSILKIPVLRLFFWDASPPSAMFCAACVVKPDYPDSLHFLWHLPFRWRPNNSLFLDYHGSKRFLDALRRRVHYQQHALVVKDSLIF